MFCVKCGAKLLESEWVTEELEFIDALYDINTGKQIHKAEIRTKTRTRHFLQQCPNSEKYTCGYDDGHTNLLSENTL